MKRTHQCPKCSSRRLWQIDSVLQVDASGEMADRISSTPLGLTAARIGERGSQFRMSTIGPLEAITCHDCGYTEFYAREFSAVLAHLATDPRNGIRFLDATVR